MVWARCWGERSREYSPSGLVPLDQGFRETQARPSAAGLSADLDLVRDRTDDRDAEPSFGELVGMALGGSRIESLTVVGDLDDEPVGMELVGDLDHTHVPGLSVRVADRVRCGLGQRQLEIREELVGQLTEPPDAGESKPAEGDVL